MGPKRDLYGELAAALRAARLCVWWPPSTSSAASIGSCPVGISGTRPFDKAAVERGLAEGWELFNPDFADFYWVQQTSKFEDFFAQWQLKVREVIDKYQPDMMWFDGGKFREDGYEETALEILAHYLESSGCLGERGAGAEQAACQHAIQLPSRLRRYQL